MAAKNKCLARSNKSRTGVPATNKRPAARRNSSQRSQFGETRFGVSVAGLSPPFGGASRAEAEHELAPSRPVFLLLPRSQSRGVLAPSIIDDELLARRRKPPVAEPRRSTVNEKAADPPSPPQYVDPSSPPKYLKNVRPLEGLQRDRPARPTEGRASERPSDFSRLSESVKDLPPKEQASRVRQHFGILGGARPAEGPGRRAKNAGH